MSIDRDTVKKVARLARIAVSEDEAESLKSDLNEILNFVEQLNEVDVSGADPMTAVVDVNMKMRSDIITASEQADQIVSNAPAREGHFFVVPKVVE